MPPFNRFGTVLSLLLAAFVFPVLQSCGGGGGGGLTADADPSGYYDVTGTATVKAEDNSTDLAIRDLQAMVDGGGDRIMMMGTGLFNGNDARFLYDGTITSRSQDSFTADFTIYTTEVVLASSTDGQNPITATASGTITEGSSITGALVGSGAGNGTFSLTYAVSNNQAADISRIENGPGNGNWAATIGGGSSGQEFIIDNIGVITHVGSSVDGIFRDCEMDGEIISINESSLYNVTVTLTSCSASLGLPNGDYTGLAASRTEATADDTLVFAVTNGTYSPNGEFK